MKAGWQNMKLEDLCLFLNGLWKGGIEPLVQVGVIRNTNFTKDGALDYSDIAYLDVEEKKFAKRRLEYGDIILEKSGGGPKQAVGRVVLFDKKEGDFSFSNFTSAIRIINKHELDFKFLHRFLYWTYVSGVTEKIQSNSTGIRNLDGNAYKAIHIQFPVITEQQRIVAILDKAFEGIAKARASAEQNLQNARALFESYLHSIDAEKRELGDFVSIKTGKLDANAAVEGGAYPFFTCSRDIYRIDKFAFDCEAILLAGNNASGDFNVKHYIGKFNAYQRTYVITINNQNEASYRYLYFQLLAKLKEFKKQSVGSNTKFLKIGMIQSMKIPMPLFAEQQAIVVKLDGLLTETQRLEALYQRKIACLDELKKSLLQQAFAGEL